MAGEAVECPASLAIRCPDSVHVHGPARFAQSSVAAALHAGSVSRHRRTSAGRAHGSDRRRPSPARASGRCSAPARRPRPSARRRRGRTARRRAAARRARCRCRCRRPRSRRRRRGPSGDAEARSVTRPPAGVWRSAFETRLPRICASRSGSAHTSGASSASTAISTPAVSARASNSSAVWRSASASGTRAAWTGQFARVGDGERVEALDKPRQALGLDAGGADALGRRRERAGLDQFERPEHGRDGRPQVVRHVGRHALAERGRLGEARAHRVEGVGERADLVVARDAHGLPKLAGRDPARGVREPAQRADGPPGQPDADDERDGEREPECDGERGRGRGDKARLGAGRGKVGERGGSVAGDERGPDRPTVDQNRPTVAEVAGVSTSPTSWSSNGRTTRPSASARPNAMLRPSSRGGGSPPAAAGARPRPPRGAPVGGPLGSLARAPRRSPPATPPARVRRRLEALHERLERLLDHEPLERSRRRDAHRDGDEERFEHAHRHERERPPRAERPERARHEASAPSRTPTPTVSRVRERMARSVARSGGLIGRSVVVVGRREGVASARRRAAPATASAGRAVAPGRVAGLPAAVARQRAAVLAAEAADELVRCPARRRGSGTRARRRRGPTARVEVGWLLTVRVELRVEGEAVQRVPRSSERGRPLGRPGRRSPSPRGSGSPRGG